MRTIDQNSLGLDVVYVKLEKAYTLANDKPIRNADDAVAAIAEVLKDLDREVVCLVTMKNNNVPINASIVSVGTANAAMVCPREILKTSILSNASRIMLFHNHPSGGAMPSLDDIRLTDRLKQCCDLMDIQFLDHIIIGAASKEWFSFTEKQMIKPFEYRFKSDLQELDLSKKDNGEQLNNSRQKQLSKAAEPEKVYKRAKAR